MAQAVCSGVAKNVNWGFASIPLFFLFSFRRFFFLSFTFIFFFNPPFFSFFLSLFPLAEDP